MFANARDVGTSSPDHRQALRQHRCRIATVAVRKERSGSTGFVSLMKPLTHCCEACVAQSQVWIDVVQQCGLWG
ncbi:hypothetical protein ABZ570_31855 [Micromonospora sp. NPDC007271]|uniref:hypothetical protein n=1 Tax=Micromonospora sp. NPDC007271 TaxID=3154587 RepID=UPI0033FD3997